MEEGYAGKFPAVRDSLSEARGGSRGLQISCVLRVLPIDPVGDVTEKTSKRKLVNVAERQQMPFVEIRAGSVLSKIVRVHQDRIAAVGRVVDGVAVGIRETGGERTTLPARRELKCVMGR